MFWLPVGFSILNTIIFVALSTILNTINNKNNNNDDKNNNNDKTALPGSAMILRKVLSL